MSDIRYLYALQFYFYCNTILSYFEIADYIVNFNEKRNTDNENAGSYPVIIEADSLRVVER